MKTDTSHPIAGDDLILDELTMFRAAVQARYSAMPLPPCCMMAVRNGEKWIPRVLPISPGKFALMKQSNPGAVPEPMVVGLSMEDAEARAHRLTLPNQPDGFHLWN